MLADPVSPHPGGPEPYWKCVVAAAPQLLLSLQFELVSRGYTPFGLSADDLTSGLTAEAIAIYFGLVIGAYCVFLPGGGFSRAFRNLLIVTALIGIAASGYSMGPAPWRSSSSSCSWPPAWGC